MSRIGGHGLKFFKSIKNYVRKKSLRKVICLKPSVLRKSLWMCLLGMEKTFYILLIN